MKEKARMKSDSPSGLASYCRSVMFCSLHKSATVAVLKLLAAATRTWVVAARQLVGNIRLLWLLLACVLIGGSTLCFILKAVLALLITLLWSLLLSRGFLYLLLLNFRNLSACEYRRDAVVHVVHHRVEQLCALKLEDEQRILLLV